MTVSLTPININDDKFRTLVERANEIINALGTSVVTVGTPTTGDVSINGTISANVVYSGNNAVVTGARGITVGAGLQGGGTLNANVNISLNANTIASLAKADTALQANAFTGKLGFKDKISVPTDIDALGTANSITVLAGDGTWRPINAIGDMNKVTYDPNNIQADVFNRANHTGSQPSNTIVGLDTNISNLQANVAARMPISTYDPQLINGDAFARANHTGTQSANTITGLANVATSGSYLSLTNRTAVDFVVAQPLTQAQQGQARANIDASILTGWRNKLINGDFDIWQRGLTQSVNYYGSDDRWLNVFGDATRVHSRQLFDLGQTAVPGNPRYFSRTQVTAANNTSGHYIQKVQAIEGVRTLSGKRATLTFYAKADAAKPMSIELAQLFGSGGSPSADVVGIGSQQFNLTTSWQKFSTVIDVPSIAGKTLGTIQDNRLLVIFWFSAGSSYSARSAGLTIQTGVFDIAHVSLVEGDATAEHDPFEYRHPQQELSLCQRYFCTITTGLQLPAIGNGLAYYKFPVQMRDTPSMTVANPGGTNGATITNAAGNLTSQGAYFQITTTAANGYVDGWTGYFDAEL